MSNLVTGARIRNALVNSRAVVVLAVVGLVAAALIAANQLHTTAREIVISEAQRTSVAWARYIGAELDRIEAIASGAELTPAEIDFLSGVREFGNIFRFKLFDRDGELRLISDDLRTARTTDADRKAEHSDTAKHVVATAKVSSSLYDGSKKPHRPDVYAETYAPVYRDNELVAVVEVYTDQTALQYEVMRDFTLFGLKVFIAVLIGMSLPIIALAYLIALVREQNRRLEEAEVAKSHFFAHMNHELRTPLNSIIGYSEVLATGQLGRIENPKHREYVEDIHASGNHLLSLVNKVLDMTKIDAGAFDVEPETFSVADLIGHVVELMSLQIAKKNVSLIVDADCESVHLHADLSLCRQMLLNLIDNAIKFSRRDGTIAVHADIDIHGRVVISVQDTGVGISPKDLEQVVKPFGQSRESALISHEMGTGLGLPLCVRMMELHGGSLSLDSEFGKGTNVTLTFPEHRTVRRRAPRPELIAV
ncbi:MAG: HAMP domain-containing sensor histidine kinase [Rhodospirillales bacterium]